ncbi:response regulator transcription factor, partial [Bacillus sp. S34]|nr:response regulator transcription factor [Bacillus sp. S34]
PQLLDAIRTISRGEALVDPAVTRTLIGSFAGRIRPPVAPADTADDLTPRELEVLRLLARGLSNVEIAEAMFVTRETAKTYVSRILLKLGVRDRVQAVVYAYRTGIADGHAGHGIALTALTEPPPTSRPASARRSG